MLNIKRNSVSVSELIDININNLEAIEEEFGDLPHSLFEKIHLEGTATRRLRRHIHHAIINLKDAFTEAERLESRGLDLQFKNIELGR